MCFLLLRFQIGLALFLFFILNAQCQNDITDPCSRLRFTDADKEILKNSFYFKLYSSRGDPYLHYTDCVLSNIVVTNNTIFKFTPNNGTTSVSAINCTLITIPKGLFENLAGITHVSFPAAGITTLSQNDFTAATNLISINFTSNLIDKLVDNSLSKASKLRSIDMSFNNISSISSSAFDNLDNLDVLILNNNRIAAFECKISSIGLKVLRLNGNQMHTFAPVLLPYTKLAEISLGKNLLTSFPDSLNIDFSQIAKVDISSNPFSTIVNGSFTSATNLNISNTASRLCYILPTMEMLDASHNQIDSVIVQDVTDSLIQELSLSNNKLTSMANLTQLKYLMRLDLSFNAITDIGMNSFANMIYLQILDLEYTGLKHIEFGMFSHLSFMKILDLSYNRLGQIDLSMFMFMDRMENIFLEGNDLRTLDAVEIPKIFPFLQFIGIGDNQFNCSYLLNMLKLLAVNRINVHLSADSIVKNSTNILGIGCAKNSNNDTNSSWSLPPMHQSEHVNAFKAIENKINSIIANVNGISNRTDEITKQQFQTDIGALQDELDQFKNDMDPRLINQKLDIVSSVSRLYSGSENRTNEYLNFKFQIDENRRVNLERFQVLSDRLDKMLQSVTTSNVVHQHQADRLVSGGNTLAKTNISIWLGVMVCGTMLAIAICIATVFVLYKKRFSRPRRSINAESSNTINTLI